MNDMLTIPDTAMVRRDSGFPSLIDGHMNLISFKASDATRHRPSDTTTPYSSSTHPRLHISNNGPLHQHELLNSKYDDKDRTWRFPRSNQVRAQEIYPGESTYSDDDSYVVFDGKRNDVATILFHSSHHLPDFQPDIEELEPVVNYQDHAPADENVKTLLYEARNHLPDTAARISKEENVSMNLSSTRKSTGVKAILFHPMHHLPDFQPDADELEAGTLYGDPTHAEEKVTTLLYDAIQPLPDTAACAVKDENAKTVLSKIEKDVVGFQPPKLKRTKQATAILALQPNQARPFDDRVHIDFDDMAPSPGYL